MATSDNSAIELESFTMTTGGSLSFHGTGSAYVHNAPPRQCEFAGHRVARWAEYLDGQCVGYCDECNERVQSLRPPGGLPFMRLKALVEQLIGEPEAADLFLEINEVEALLDNEQSALDDARALLRTARKMSEWES